MALCAGVPGQQLPQPAAAAAWLPGAAVQAAFALQPWHGWVVPRQAVLRDARQRLQALQQAQAERLAQLDLFVGAQAGDAQAPEPADAAQEQFEQLERLALQLAEIDCDALSPRDALDALYRLREQARTLHGGDA